MRILVLSKAFPEDPRTKVHGAHQRLRLFIDALKPVSRLDFLFFVEQRIDTSANSRDHYRRLLSEHWDTDLDLTLVSREPAAGSRWEMYGPGMLDPFGQPNFLWASGDRQLLALEEALERAPDAVFVHRLASMSPVLRTAKPVPPIYFDLDDIEHVALRRSIPQPPVWAGKWLRLLHLPALWWGERRAISRAHRTFVCSERDRRYLSRTMRVSGVTVIPNAVKIREPQEPPAEPTLLFLGSMNHPPNRNAASFLLREIWPRVRTAVPEARLVIAGKHASLIDGYRREHANVEFPGFVEDLAELYRRTRVVCVPILAGAGTRIKILEAAAFGKPIVSTPAGVEGLGLVDERHLLVRADPEAFARAAIELLSDSSRCRSLGLAAHAAVRRAYARERVMERIRSLFTE